MATDPKEFWHFITIIATMPLFFLFKLSTLREKKQQEEKVEEINDPHSLLYLCIYIAIIIIRLQGLSTSYIIQKETGVFHSIEQSRLYLIIIIFHFTFLQFASPHHCWIFVFIQNTLSLTFFTLVH